MTLNTQLCDGAATVQIRGHSEGRVFPAQRDIAKHVTDTLG